MRLDSRLYDNMVNVFTQDYCIENNLEYTEISKNIDIFVSDDFKNDYSIFDNINKITSTNIAAIMIPPNDNTGKFTLMFPPVNNAEEIEFYNVMHELIHMFDFIDFTKEYCAGDYSKLRAHKYYQTFLNWSEFHAKCYDTPKSCWHLVQSTPNPESEYNRLFVSKIKTTYYPIIIKNFYQSKN